MPCLCDVTQHHASKTQDAHGIEGDPRCSETVVCFVSARSSDLPFRSLSAPSCTRHSSPVSRTAPLTTARALQYHISHTCEQATVRSQSGLSQVTVRSTVRSQSGLVNTNTFLVFVYNKRTTLYTFYCFSIKSSILLVFTRPDCRPDCDLTVT